MESRKESFENSIHAALYWKHIVDASLPVLFREFHFFFENSNTLSLYVLFIFVYIQETKDIKNHSSLFSFAFSILVPTFSEV